MSMASRAPLAARQRRWWKVLRRGRILSVALVREARRAEHSRKTTPGPFRCRRGRGTKPRERLLQALIQQHDRCVVKESLRLGDVSLGVSNVSRPRRLVDRFDPASNDPVHGRQEVFQRDASPGGDVNDFPRHVRRRRSPEHAVDVDRRPFPREQRRSEQGDDARIGRPRILTGPEHIEVPDGDRFEPVQPRKHLAILLDDEFLEGIRGEWVRRHVFAFRQHRRIAVRRR